LIINGNKTETEAADIIYYKIPITAGGRAQKMTTRSLFPETKEGLACPRWQYSYHYSSLTSATKEL
jgi:hypothetical protein